MGLALVGVLVSAAVSTAREPFVATLPPELVTDPAMLDIPLRTRIPTSINESRRRVNEARRLLRERPLQEVLGELFGETGDLNETALAAQGAVDERTADLVRSIAALGDGRLFAAYHRAHRVHEKHFGTSAKAIKAKEEILSNTPYGDALDVEAALLKSAVMMRAEILPYAYYWAFTAHGVSWLTSVPEAPLTDGLRKVAKSHGHQLEAPTSVVAHPSVAGVRVEVWESPAEAEQPLVIGYCGPDDSFYGALVVRRVDVEEEPHQRFQLVYCDLDARPLPLWNPSQKLPHLSDVQELGNRFRPDARMARRGDPDFVRYGTMRCQLESLAWRRDHVWPLAAWWTQQCPEDELIAREAVAPLQRDHLANWQLNERVDFAAADGVGRARTLNFVNLDADAPAKIAALGGLLEHYHIVVTAPESGEYLFSAAVASVEPSPGRRLYSLNLLQEGEASEFKLYSGLELPDYREVAADVEAILAAERFHKIVPPKPADAQKSTSFPPWEIVATVGTMLVGTVVLFGAFYVLLLGVRKVRASGPVGYVILGVGLGLVIGAAVFWASAKNARYNQVYERDGRDGPS